MLDALIADTLEFIEGEHAETKWERDPVKLCQLWGIRYEIGPRYMARSRDQDRANDLITVTADDYGSRYLFTVAHEMAHILAKRGGYVRLIKHYHASVPDMRRHIELIINYAAGRLLMPAPDLLEAWELYRDRPDAVLHLMKLSGASEPAAMRRWTWQDVTAYRGAFTATENYIQDVTACRAKVPFRRHDRVPELHILHPDVSLISLGGGRVMGTIA
ncbi:hypothetical protein GCM10008949_08850 [Deinococcus humi]|nr:hypothetical protein GCM10008949_08850 [Deinococcus humi]